MTVTQDISSIFCYFWEGVYIGGTSVYHFLCWPCCSFVFFCTLVGFYHLIVKKRDGEDISRAKGWSDLKRRGERCMVYILDVV